MQQRNIKCTHIHTKNNGGNLHPNKKNSNQEPFSALLATSQLCHVKIITSCQLAGLITFHFCVKGKQV